MPTSAGCTTWQTRRIPADQLLDELRPRELRVQRSNGTRVELERPVLRNDSVAEAASGLGVPLTEVRVLQVRGFSLVRTVLLLPAGLVASMLPWMIGGAVCRC